MRENSTRGKNWFEKPVRVLQFNIEDRHGVVVSSLSGRELVELANKIGANVLVIFARDPWGRAFYRGSSISPVHQKLRGDLVREAVEAGRRKGIKVVVMIGHTANKYMYRLHSDWAQVNHRGETILLEHVPYNEKDYEPEWPQMCLNSPFMDFVEKEISEVMKLGVDGVFLDSFRYQPDLERACYCKWCQEKFMKEYGYEMPREPKWNDSRWRELWKWRYRVVVEKLKRLYEYTKKISPNTLFMYNSHPGGWAGRTNKVVEMARDYIDVVFAECSEVDHQPPGFITEMVKLTKAMNGGKPVWASRNYFHLYRTVSSTTPLAIRQGLREAILGGGSPWLLVFSISYRQDPSVLEAAKKVFEEHKKLEEYLDGAEPLRHVGIIVSNNTRDFYGRDHPEDYVDEIRGFYYALVHNHIPVEFISEKDATNPMFLKKYRVLVLANTVCMSDKVISNIREYVASGGRIIATYLASTCNEECIERYDFGLRDVLGVEEKGLLKQPWSYVIPRDDHPVFSNVDKKLILWGDMSYDFTESRTARSIGWHVLVETIGDARVLATIGIPGGEWGYEYTLGRSPPPLGVETKGPAIVENKYGVGLSVYYSGQLGRHYWRTGLPEYMKLIVNTIRYLGGEPNVVVDAPETVAVETFTQGNRVIVHLLNHTYNQRVMAIGIGRTKQPLPPYSSNEAVHPPREVVSVSNVVVRAKVKGGYEYRVYSPLTGKEYSYDFKNGYIVVKVGSLGEYEVLVFEPKK